VNKSLEQLIQISNFDSQISLFGPQIKAQKEKLKQFTALANKLQKSVNERLEVISESKSKKSKNNIHLDELRTKLDKNAIKMDSIGTAKEAKALQLEEEIAREQITFTNDEISRLDNIIELKESELVDLQEKLAQEEETVKLLDESISKEIALLDTKRDEISEKRNKILLQVDQKVLSFYQKIKRWAKDTAVVPVKKQACYGCFMKISDKTYSSVVAGNDIVACPHCGRVIYKDLEEQSE
jgi:predicted  nucleic acid-binding Zn-ribbon protein